MHNTSSFESFVDSIAKSSVLEPEYEYQLFCDYKENKNIHSKYQIVTAYLKLVLAIAKECLHSADNLDDLFQEGTCGLLKCIETFDHNLGNRFATYAQYQIKSSILRFIQTQHNSIRYVRTKNQSKIFYNLHKYQRGPKSFSEDQLHDIASDLNVPIDEVRRMEHFMFYHDVLLDHIHEDEEYNTGLTSDVLFTIIKDEDIRYINERTYLTNLTDREREIITTRWLDDKTTTLVELSKTYEVSTQRISQIEKNAITKMQDQYRNII